MNLVRVTAGLAAGVGAAGAALLTNSVRVSKWAKDTLNAADAVGVTTRQFQRLNAATTRFGGEGAKDTQDLLSVLNDRAEDATRGTTSFVEAFDILNIKASELEGLNTRELLMRTADGFKEVDDQAASVAAERLFGGDLGQRFIPLLKQGADGIERLGDRYERLGLILEKDTLEQSREFRKSWEDLLGIGKSFLRLLGARLAPAFDRAIDRLNGWIQANRKVIDQRIDAFVNDVADAIDWLADAFATADKYAQKMGGWGTVLKRLAQIVGTLAAAWAGSQIVGIVQGLASAFSGLWSVIGGFSGISSAITGLIGQIQIIASVGIGPWLSGLASAVASAAGPIAAIVAALGALYLVVEDIQTFMSGGDSVTGRFVEWFKSLEGGQELIEKVRAGIEAMRGWAIKLAEYWPYLKRAAIVALRTYLDYFASVIQTSIALLLPFINLAIKLFQGLWKQFQIVMLLMQGDWAGAWEKMKELVFLMLNAVGDFFYQLFDGIKKSFTSWADTLWNYISRIKGLVESVSGDMEVSGKVTRSTAPARSTVAQGRPTSRARPRSSSPRQPNVSTGDTYMTVKPAPGMDEEELAEKVEEKRREDDQKKAREVAEKLARGSEQ